MCQTNIGRVLCRELACTPSWSFSVGGTFPRVRVVMNLSYAAPDSVLANNISWCPNASRGLARRPGAASNRCTYLLFPYTIDRRGSYQYDWPASPVELSSTFVSKGPTRAQTEGRRSVCNQANGDWALRRRTPMQLERLAMMFAFRPLESIRSDE